MSPLPHRHPFRSTMRSAMLGAALVEVGASFGMRHLRRSGAKPLTTGERASWLQDGAARVLKRIGVEVMAEGNPPRHGLVVSNRLSYLDVLAYASTMPCVFVAKREVREWPVFGAYATIAGTMYVD